nr:MAG: hypothetical protein [Microvirus sp.]
MRKNKMHHTLNKRIKYDAPKDYVETQIPQKLQRRDPSQQEKPKDYADERRRQVIDQVSLLDPDYLLWETGFGSGSESHYPVYNVSKRPNGIWYKSFLYMISYSRT